MTGRMKLKIDEEKINYKSVEDTIRSIENSHKLGRPLNVSISLALGLPVLSGDDAKNLPRYVELIDHAKDLFIKVLGPVEHTFVYSIMTDFGNLRRATISDGGLHVTKADAGSEAAALTCALLKMVLLLR